MKNVATFGLLMLMVFLSADSSALAQNRNRPPTQKTTAQSDIRIKYRTTVAGQTTESTSMVKGVRDRSESGSAYAGNSIVITQCDLKRTIQLSEKTRKYVITPMDQGSTTATGEASSAPPSGATRRGGTVTYTTTTTDTGERKEMFGFTARHVKTTVAIESSPDACTSLNQRMETDGWYIDLNVGLDCELGRPQMMSNRAARPDCQDRTQIKRVGTGKIGYPLTETMTMYGADGAAMFTMSKDVVELSREPLDPSLFDIPAGYTEAQSTQELYASEATDSMPTADRQESSSDSSDGSATTQKPSGVIRVGVMPLNNKTDHQVSVDSLRDRLIGEIAGAGVEAVPLNAESLTAAEVEARSRGCDFILFTDISALKGSKVGGMFGRVTGMNGAGKTDSRVDFKLFAVGDTTPRLQSSTTGKDDGDEQSAMAALSAEAKTVVGAVRKR